MSTITELLAEAKAAFGRSNNGIALQHVLNILEGLVSDADTVIEKAENAVESALASEVAILRAKVTDLESKLAALSNKKVSLPPSSPKNAG
jgi:hypothetical protein